MLCKKRTLRILIKQHCSHSPEFMKRTLFFAVLIFLISGNNNFVYYSDTFHKESYQIIEIALLESRSLEYDNRPIEVSGYLHMDIENLYIYINDKNKIWLDFNFFEPLKNDKNDVLNGKKLMSLKGREIKVRGIYKQNKKGHSAVYKGGITNITLLESL